MTDFKIGQYTIETEAYYKTLLETACTSDEILSQIDKNNDKVITENELMEIDSSSFVDDVNSNGNANQANNSNTNNQNSDNGNNSSASNNATQNSTQNQIANLEKTYAQQLEVYNNQLNSLEEQRRKIYNSIGTSGDAEGVSSQISEAQNITSQISKMRLQILNYMINYESKINDIQNAASGQLTVNGTSGTNGIIGGNYISGNRNYTYDFTETLSDNQKADLELFKSVYAGNIDKYKQVEAATGVPAELVAAIHWSESGCDFSTYLHNGDPLGQPTTHVPEGIYFGADQWAEAAIDAIKSQDTSIINPNDITTLYEYAERYNGLGYRNKGLASPYVWSGTSNYTGGKYVADGVFDPNAFDDTLGVAVMLKAIC